MEYLAAAFAAVSVAISLIGPHLTAFRTRHKE
jgi:hypothetical protein